MMNSIEYKRYIGALKKGDKVKIKSFGVVHDAEIATKTDLKILVSCKTKIFDIFSPLDGQCDLWAKIIPFDNDGLIDISVECYMI